METITNRIAGVNMTEKNAVFDKDGKSLDKKTLKKMLEEAEETESVDILPKEPINSIAEDKEKNKIIRVNIACGQQKQEGFIGIDKVKTDATDIVHDLEEYPWPFPDNYADEVLCSHYIEHVKDLIKFIDELWRIMKPPYVNEKGEEIKSKATMIAPYYSSIRCWQDPTHVRAISEYTFLYFNKNWRVQNKLDHYGIKNDFDFTYGYQMDPAWANRSEEARVFAMKHYINVISDIHVVITKR